MKKLRIFFIFLISLIPTNTLRKLSYNFLFNYRIDGDSQIGWFTFINCIKFECINTKIKSFNLISGNLFEIFNSEIGFMNKFKDINIVNINTSKINNKNRFIGEKKISKDNYFFLKKNSFIKDNNYFDVTDSIEIKENCSIFSYIQIWTHGFTEKRLIKKKNVIINNGCTINNACLVSMGVQIGENSVIEIGSTVTKSVLNDGFYFHKLQKK